jgi:hypothetical protein
MGKIALLALVSVYVTERVALGQLVPRSAVRVRGILVTFVGECERLDRDHVIAWRDIRRQQLAPGTMRAEWGVVRTWCRWLVAREHIDTDPCADLPAPKVPRQVPRALSPEQMAELFADLPQALQNTVELAKRCNLELSLGKYFLPDNVVMVAAGNRESDKGVTYRMPTPLVNRFVHLEMRVDFPVWQEWAVQNNIHKDVVGYLSFAKQDLYDFDAKSASRSFATPRSWTFVSELLEDEDTDETTLTDLVAGAVGEGLAVKFQAHRKIASKMPKPEEILSGKVKDLQVKEVSAMYSLVISMCYELKGAIERKVADKEFHAMSDNFFRYMMDNFETELVVMGARIALTTYNLPFQPTKLKNFDEFHQRYGKYILQASQNS